MLVEKSSSQSIDPATQRAYARLAGFLFLWLIATALSGMIVSSRIAGGGSFADAARRVSASEHLYRAALMGELIETISAAVLAFALYIALKPADPVLSQLAMYFRLGEAFTGCVGMMFGFARASIYTTTNLSDAAAVGHAAAFVGFMNKVGNASYNIGATLFACGSLLFFYVFLKSRYIPRALSIIGLIASVLVPIVTLGSLLFPEYRAPLQYGWIPMAVAEITTGVWLMIFAVPATRTDFPAMATAV